MKKALTFGIMFMFFTAVFADGMIVNTFQMPARQESQEAFIHYENGKENLFIMVNMQEAVQSGQKNVWIFPVPSSPENIEINNLRGFPRLGGEEIKQKTIGNLLGLEAYMATAAFPPFIVFSMLMMIGSVGTIGTANYETGSKAVDVSGLTIYEHIDKYGIATEVIKAHDSALFRDFLEARGTNLSSEAENFLKEYMGQDYSFVISWISDAEQAGENNGNYYGQTNPIGVFIKFPSKDIYYPLKPTAYYGNDSFPVTVNISGFKNPEIFQNIKEKTKIGHYYRAFLSRTIQEEETLIQIFNGTLPQELAYTKISINTSASYFTQDLRISTQENYGAHGLNWINQTWLFWMLLLFLGFAYLSIFLTNKLYLNNGLQRKHLIIIALSNLATAIAAAIVFAVISKKYFGLKPKEDEFSKKFSALILFEGLFLAMAILLLIITISLAMASY